MHLAPPPPNTTNHETCMYIMGHSVWLVAVVHIIMTYHMVVNHDTTLNRSLARC
jgi:hypothetical protein